MTGLDAIVYWLSFFLWDFLFFLIIAILMIISFFAFEDYALFTSNGGAGNTMRGKSHSLFSETPVDETKNFFFWMEGLTRQKSSWRFNFNSFQSLHLRS